MLRMLSLVALLLATTALGKETSPVRCVQSGRWQTTYCHLKLTLSAKNLRRPTGKNKYGDDYSSEWRDGWFEVFVAKENFPVPTPDAKKYLILKMQKNNDPAARAVHADLSKILATGEGEREVVVEFHHYDQQKQAMGGVNLWFRMAHGRYIDYLGPLKPAPAKSAP